MEVPTVSSDIQTESERVVQAYATALNGFSRFPSWADLEKARRLITEDPGWCRVGMIPEADAKALLKKYGIAVPRPSN